MSRIDDFYYDLPDERIAAHPLEERDQAKLLQCRGGVITDHSVSDVPPLLQDALVILNDTKVIPARISWLEENGERIEVFCVEPVDPTTEVSLALQTFGETTWRCMVGNNKAWVSGVFEIASEHRGTIRIERVKQEGNLWLVRFVLPSSLPMSEALATIGTVPLPPYIKRDVSDDDLERYQTVFADKPGAVAAPTASLHFTNDMIAALDTASVTLHVGLGTFLPVKTELVEDHIMHGEKFSVSKQLLQRLRAAVISGQPIVPIGTTAMRVIESLPGLAENLDTRMVPQWTWKESQIDPIKTLDILLAYCDKEGVDSISGVTSIMIIPGFPFTYCSGLVTNFHQPKSTLLALVSAFLDPTDWRHVYAHALEEGYRFLSYGDTSLLWRGK